MVISHPWLLSAIGELERKLRISHYSRRTKQVSFIETPPFLLRHQVQNSCVISGAKSMDPND